MTDIYLIDDDPLVNFLNKELIQEMMPDSHITTFESASQALQILGLIHSSANGVLPKYLFLDINMPILDGWEFLDQFSRLPESIVNHIKVYLLSSSIDWVDIERSANHPMVVAYLEKPLTMEQLQAKGVMAD